MEALHQQARDKRKEAQDQQQKMNALEKQQMQLLIEKDEKHREEERKKNEARKKLGQQWMLAAEEQYQKNAESAKNGANRGQKMSLEELRLNKHILKEVRDAKRKGEFTDLYTKCINKKITNVD